MPHRAKDGLDNVVIAFAKDTARPNAGYLQTHRDTTGRLVDLPNKYFGFEFSFGLAIGVRRQVVIDKRMGLVRRMPLRAAYGHACRFIDERFDRGGLSCTFNKFGRAVDDASGVDG